VTLEAKISTRINHSKAAVSTTAKTAVRNRVHSKPILLCPHFSKQTHLKLSFRKVLSQAVECKQPVVESSRKTVGRYFRDFLLPKCREGAHTVHIFSFRVTSGTYGQLIHVGHQRLPRHVIIQSPPLLSFFFRLLFFGFGLGQIFAIELLIQKGVFSVCN